MDVAALVVAIVLGGSGVLGAVYNWYTFRTQHSRQRTIDFWESYERQAASAERRNDRAEVARIRQEYEEQLEAYRAQQQLKRLVPPDRIEP